MGLLERVIRALIYIAFVVLAFYLIIWFIGMMGIVMPAKVIMILGVILALFCLLVLVRMFAGSWNPNWRVWP